MNIIKIFTEDELMKKSFDLWILNFDIKDGVGSKPDYFSLIHSLQFDLKRIVERTINEQR